MYKLLLVDDEPSVLDYLPAAIDWESLGVTTIFKASDARSALQSVSENMPDIAIVDVEMPGKDGLEFCREARKINPRIKFVILSAFDKFDYARRAITVGADDYLLKPVDEDELFKLIRNIVTGLSRSSRNSLLNHEARMHAVEKALGELFQNLLQLRSPAHNPGEDFRYLDGYRDLCIVMQGNEDTDECRNILGSAAGEGSMTFTLSSGFYAVFWKSDIRISMQQKIDRLAQQLRKEDFHIWTAYVQASATENIPQTFIRCFHELEKQFYGSDSPDKDSGYENSPDQNFMMPDLRDGMNLLSEEGEISLLSESVHSAMSAAFARKVEPVKICSMLMDVLITLKMYLTKYWQQDAMDLFRRISTDSLLRCGSKEKLSGTVDRYLCELQLFVRRQQKEHGNFYIVRIAKEYTREHYQESSLSLQDVADAAGTSRTYFSRVYRELTGEKYWDYLSRYRISRAKDLLSNTNMTQSEISELVGYESEYHFSRKFKELTGLSPNKFRKK